MADIIEGRFVSDTVDAVLNAMVADFEAQVGEELPPGASSNLRSLYFPVAVRLVEAQRDLGLILDSAQIDHASKQALDLLTALINVPRLESRKATGEVTFTRESSAPIDYQIPSGTEVQTEGNDPVVFVTTETVTLAQGATSVDAKIEARSGGKRGNVGSGSITSIRSSVAGPDDVSNAAATDGGADRENDEELRSRAKKNLTSGAAASANAIYTSVVADPNVKSVSLFMNPDGTTDEQGLGGHNFEVVTELKDSSQESLDDVAQAILDTMAAGSISASGVWGTARSGTGKLINGQEFVIGFSESTPVKIYVSIDMTVTSEYEGDQAVQDEIVRYIGGVLSSENFEDGRLDVGQDVIYGSVEYAIRSVEGVFDINTLTVGTSASPTGTSNLDIALGEKATVDATDGSITIVTSVVEP